MKSITVTTNSTTQVNQTWWMTEHGFGKELYIKYTGTGGVGIYYITPCRPVDANKLEASGCHNMPRPSLPSVGAEALQADRGCTPQRSSRFLRSPMQLPDALMPCWVKRPGDLDLLTLKVVSESRATWATSVPILVFLGLCSRLRPDVCDRQTDVRQHHRLMPHLLGVEA